MDIPVSTLLQKKTRSASAPDLMIVLLFLNNNNIIMHKRMLPDKTIMLNPLHNADFLTCNNFR